MVRREKLTEEDLKLSSEKVQYHVYDFPGLMHEPFEVRMDCLVELCYRLDYQPTVQVVNTVSVSDESKIDEAYGKFIEAGYEGGIIRLNGPYEQKRSNNLIKRKDFDDDEFTIIRVEEGKGNWAGCAKKIYIVTSEGHECEATIQGSMDYCRHVLENAESYIGKQATVAFFGYTPAGALRFPVAKVLHEDTRW
jgi:DNA ligase-1